MKFNIDNYTVGSNPTVLTLVCETEFEKVALTHLVDQFGGRLSVSVCREEESQPWSNIKSLIIYKRESKKKQTSKCS